MKLPKLKLILVDDYEAMRMEMKCMLEELLGVGVRTAGSLELLERLLVESGEDFDIIVSDRVVGRGNFLEWARKNDKLLSGKAVVMYSGCVPDIPRWDRPRFPMVELKKPEDIGVVVREEIHKLLETKYGY